MEKTKILDFTEKNLIIKFKEVQKNNVRYVNEQQKSFEPIEKAIESVESNIKDVLGQNQDLILKAALQLLNCLLICQFQNQLIIKLINSASFEYSV